MQTPSHRADPRWATRAVRVGAAVVLVAALVLLVLIALSNAAKATGGSGGPPAAEETYDGPDGTYVGEVKPGAPCIGNESNHGTKDGKPYLCWHKKGQDCPRWHRVIVPGEPTGKWSPRPYSSPCPQCSPSPTPPASSAPPSQPPTSSAPPSSAPPASSPPPSQDDGPKLPVTGVQTAAISGAGVLLLLFGAGLVRYSNRGAGTRRR